MNALTVILTSSPARYAPLVSASGIGIAPAPVEAGAFVEARRAAGRALKWGEVVPFAPLVAARRAG